MNKALSPEKVHWPAIAIIYSTSILQGLAMVSFPASGTVLKDIKGLTDAQYGLIFIPQIIAAIIGSIAGGGLARTLGLKKLLFATLIATALSQLGLLTAVEILPQKTSFFMVLGSTAMFGLAFGIGAAPLNTYPGLLFPQKSDSALVALHTLLGMGLSAGPLLVGPLTRAGFWLAYPLLLVGLSTLLFILLHWSRPPEYGVTESSADTDQDTAAQLSAERLFTKPVLWGFVAIVILYAFAEGTFANWCIIYLNEERSIALTQASYALSVFWAMIAGGRLLVSALLLKVRAEWIWLALPLMMATSFLLIPLGYTASAGIALFALAGLSCSAFFPLSVGLISKRFPESAPLVSSLMIASLMIGIGVGSFIIGPLRGAVSLERLYQYSASYPAGAFVLAFATVAYRWLQKGVKVETCRQVLGRPC